MKAEYKRSVRVAALLKEEISNILKFEVKDHRINEFVTITGVDLSPDLHYAKVSVSVLGSEEQKQDSLVGLKSAAGYIRFRLKKTLRLKYLPELKFFLDRSLERVAQIDKLLSQVRLNETDENY